MKLTVLGSHAAGLRPGAFPTSQILEMRGHLMMIDCGEASQWQLRKSKTKFARLKRIFISHLHGDHFYGLIGLISSFQLLGRTTDMWIYGPKGLKEIIMLQLELTNAYMSYPIHFIELNSDKPELIFEDEKISVTTIPLRHRVYCNGFLFQEKEGPRRINIEAVEKYNVDRAYFNRLKAGRDVPNKDGENIANTLVTYEPHPSKSYAFCSDTAYHPEVASQVQDVTLLYHESTFLNAHQHLCEKTKHSTASQAAQIATQAQVKYLLLGHYSGRYNHIEKFRQEAQEHFQNVLLAKDGKVIEFNLAGEKL